MLAWCHLSVSRVAQVADASHGFTGTVSMHLSIAFGSEDI